MPAKIIIPSETRFGKLVVQGPVKNKAGSYWLCLCDCGQQSEVRGDHLRKNRTTSCGTCPRESKTITHGMSDSPEFGIWKHIKGRCLNPTDDAFARYGGRGITMSNEWQTDFSRFHQHVGPRPTPTHTIERIDNNQGYEPGNVKWDTRKAQARNRRSNLMLTMDGRTLCAAEWAEVLGIDIKSLCARKYLGWSDERALTQPLRPHPKRPIQP